MQHIMKTHSPRWTPFLLKSHHSKTCIFSFSFVKKAKPVFGRNWQNEPLWQTLHPINNLMFPTEIAGHLLWFVRRCYHSDARHTFSCGAGHSSHIHLTLLSISTMFNPYWSTFKHELSISSQSICGIVVLHCIGSDLKVSVKLYLSINNSCKVGITGNTLLNLHQAWKWCLPHKTKCSFFSGVILIVV